MRLLTLSASIGRTTLCHRYIRASKRQVIFRELDFGQLNVMRGHPRVAYS